MTQPPLTGVTVLDLTQIMAGPFCTMLLADMGATVIKIERPGGGDDSRRLGPPFVGVEDRADPTGESTAFLGLNRGKKSAVLNLKHTLAVEAVQRMATKADILVENWRTGTMESLGLGFQALSVLNPGLIYCSITGFGVTGPYADRGGFDLIAQGMSGLMSITGEPGRPPVKVGVPIADLNAGAFAAYGILAAYVNRLKSGKGQFLETSLLEAAMAYTVYESMIYLNTGEVSGPLGSAHRLSAPYQALRTKDGYLNIGAANPANWERFAKAIGREELISDPRFRLNSDRRANYVVLADELEKTLASKTRAEWLEVLEKVGVPAGPIYDMSELWSDPHIQARDMCVEMEHPRAGVVGHINNPVRLADTPARLTSAAPVLGRHTDEALEWAGYSEDEIAALRRSGAAG